MDLYFIEFLDIKRVLENTEVDTEMNYRNFFFYTALQKTFKLPTCVLSDILAKSCNHLSIYEVDMPDDMAMEIIELFNKEKTCKQVSYVLATKTICFACRTTVRLISKALTYNPMITAISFKDCGIPSRIFALLLYAKLKHLKSITLSSIEDCYFLPVSMVNNYVKVVSYLKLLNLSKGYIPVNVIITLLQSCVIEKLVVSDNYKHINEDAHICDKVVYSVFIAAYYKENYVLNFIKGVPLIIINSFQGDDHSSVEVGADETLQENGDILKNKCTVFLINTVIDEHVVDLKAVVSEYNISVLQFFFNEIVLLHNFNHIFTRFQSTLKNSHMLTVFGTDLMDETAITIANCLTKESAINVHYFLISDTKFLTNIVSLQTLLNTISCNRDVRDSDFVKELFGMFCKSLLCKDNLLKHLRNLDLSSVNLCLPYTSLLVESLQYCHVETITVDDSKTINEIVNFIFGAYDEGKEIFSFNCHVPMIFIRSVEYVNTCSNQILVKVFFKPVSSQDINDNFTTYSNSIYTSIILYFKNCLLCDDGMNNLEVILSNLQRYPLFFLLIYQVGLNDIIASNANKQLDTIPEKVEYVLGSESMLLAFNSGGCNINKALVKNYSIVTFDVTKCEISEDRLNEMGHILSTKCTNLKNITLSHCDISDVAYEQFSNLVFSYKSVISYLKKLDISQNKITSASVSTIITSLKYCIIETFIMSSNDINEELCYSVFEAVYFGGADFLNFTTGIPIILINSAQMNLSLTSDVKLSTIITDDGNSSNTDDSDSSAIDDSDSSTTEDSDSSTIEDGDSSTTEDSDSSTTDDQSSMSICSITVFAVNTTINEQTIRTMSDVSDDSIFDYRLFIKNVSLQNMDLLLYFVNFLHRSTGFSMFGTDLMDEVAVEITKTFLTLSDTNFVYLLLSETKLLSNASSEQPMFNMITYCPFICSDDVSNELFGMFCISLSCDESLFRYFKYLDISYYKGLPTYFRLLLISLQYCCIEVLAVSSLHDLKLMRDAIFDIYSAKQDLCNFNSGIPLKVIFHNNLLSYVDAFFVNYTGNKKLMDCFDESIYSEKCKLVFLNCFKCCQQMSEILSIMQGHLYVNMVIFELGIPDETILQILKSFRMIQQGLEYVLSSKSLLFAFKANDNEIIKALTHNHSIVTFKATHCTMSDAGFQLLQCILSTKCECLKNITLSQCCVSDGIYEQFSNSLFSHKSVISYLKKLDISCNNITSSCVSTIITSLQFCIIEKFVISGKEISDQLISMMFIKGHSRRDDLLNFAMGVPLTIVSINDDILKEASLNHMSNFSVFISNVEINKKMVNLITDVSGYNVQMYKLFIFKDNVLDSNLDTSLSSFKCILQMATNFVLVGYDLMDKIAMNIISFLTEVSKSNVDYFVTCKNTSESLIKLTKLELILKESSITKQCIVRDLIIPLTLSKHIKMVDFSGCNMNDEEFISVMKFMSQFCLTIKILDISQNRISPLTVLKVVQDFWVQKLYLQDKTQDILSGLFPHISIVTKRSLELNFSESTAIIFCSLWLDDIMSTAFSSQHVSHFVIMNCSMDKENSFLEYIISILNKETFPILSSVYLYNNSLKSFEIVKIVKCLAHVNLFIQEYDFKFKRVLTDDYKLNDIAEILFFPSEICSNFQIKWIMPSSLHNNKHIVFCCVDVTMITYALQIAQILQCDDFLYRVGIINSHITNEVTKNLSVMINKTLSLQFLEFINLNISESSMIILLQSLKRTTVLKLLTLNSINTLNNRCTSHLASIISKNTSLEHIEISNCNLEETTFAEMSKSLKASVSLKHLDLSNNIISDVAASKLANALNIITTLKHLDLSSTKLQETGVIDIMQGLINSNLEYLSLSNCNITNNAVAEIASCVPTSLKSLDLSNCKMHETSLICITDKLKKASSLRQLNLSYNIITDAIADNLAKVISNNVHIISLKLSLSDANFRKIAYYCFKGSLKKLDFKFVESQAVNYFTPKLEDVIVETEVYDFLVKDDVYIPFNNLDDNLYEEYSSEEEYIAVQWYAKEITHFTITHCSSMEIFTGLDSLSTLQHLDVNSSTIACDIIVNTLQNNPCLKHINISNCYWQEVYHVVNDFEEDTWQEKKMFYEIAKYLSSLQKLEHLNISGNKITSRTAKVVATTINNNKRLRHLDLSNCLMQTTALLTISKALKNINHLAYLDISFNSISKEVSMEINDAIMTNRELVHLNVTDCNFSTELDEKSSLCISNLMDLNLSRSIISNKTISALGKAIASNSNLQYFNISYCKLAEDRLKTIFDSLKTISTLKHLDITQCAIISCAAESLAAILCCNKGLEHLNLSGCQLLEMDIIKILEELKQNCLLKYFNLRSNTLHTLKVPSNACEDVISRAVQSLADVINNNTFFEYINLSNCGLSGSEVAYITTALSGSSHLQFFNISHNVITEEAAVGVASVITNNISLEHLYMSNCGLKEDCIETVIDVLLLCRYIRTLDLSKNQLAEKRIFDIVHNNAMMEHLSLSHCSSIFSSDVDHSKFSHSNVKYLNFDSNDISLSAANAIASFISMSGIIEYLNISNCNLSEDSLLKILSALMEINTLQYLNLGLNKITEKGETSLYIVVCNNQKIEQLVLNNCDLLGDLLLGSIQHCRSLKYLDISHNSISDEIADTIAFVIACGTSLQYLNISECDLYEDGNEFIITAITNNIFMSWGIAEDDDDTDPGIVAVVVSNFRLLVLLLSNESVIEHNKALNIIKVLCYFNLRDYNISEKVQEYFVTAKIKYLNFSNSDLSDYNICMMMHAAKQINTLQFLILKSTKIIDEVIEDIATIISNNSSIAHLDLSDCQLIGAPFLFMSKPLQKLSTLKNLDISHNEITDEIAIELSAVITNNKSLQYLNISSCGISDIGIQIICKALKGINSLLSLNISDNHITRKNADIIAAAVSCNKMLETIRFSNCFTEDALCTTLSYVSKEIKKSLTHLDLGRTIINDNSADEIIMMVTSNPIEYLNLSNCTLTEVGMNKLLSTLKTAAALEHLVLRSNKLLYNITEIISFIMKRNYNLKHLDVSNCELSHFQVMSFITLLFTLPCSIQYFDLSFNNETETSLTKQDDVRPLLISNNTIIHLNLSSCSLTDKDMCNVLLMLSMCSSLNYLSMQSCTIPDGISVGCIIANSNNLKYLDISDCKLHEEEIIVIAACLKVAKSIEYLLLSSNVITDAAAKEIASAIYHIPLLKHLSLSDCELEDVGILYITDSLKQISSLQHLDLSYNIISDEAPVSIASALCRNTSLECLDMSYCTWPSNGLEIIQETLESEKFTMLKEVDFTTL